MNEELSTSCGINKWSISINDDGEVIVEFGRHPIDGTIILGDTVEGDFENLAAMFAAAVIKFKAK